MIGKLFVISAACGAGKSTLVKAVLEELRFTVPIEPVITYTTRLPRQNEEQGRDYYFIDINDFERRIQDGFFLEWSNAYGAYYGSPRSLLNACQQGRSFMFILDRAGVEQLLQQGTDTVLIWIEVSSMAQLKDRLARRATETEGQIERRLQRAKIEIELERQKPIYHYRIINDDFGTAKLALLTIVLQELAEKSSKKKLTDMRIQCAK